jgi:hypothetical protein
MFVLDGHALTFLLDTVTGVLDTVCTTVVRLRDHCIVHAQVVHNVSSDYFTR